MYRERYEKTLNIYISKKPYLSSMTDKIRFFPLDVMYKVIDEKPVIHLFGKTSDNKQICVLYDSFEPYFYVIPKKGFDISKELKSFKTTQNNKTYSLTKTETVKKDTRERM